MHMRVSDSVSRSGQKPLVLHVPFTYFPEPCGGTEIYVHGLALGLPRLGFEVAVAAPGRAKQEYQHDGVAVYRFAVDQRQRLEHAYGEPDQQAAEGFADLLGQLQPAVVHLHARTAAVSGRLVDIAHEHGARVVFTYHTPTVSCARGTMLLHGTAPCDGRLERARCIRCAMAAHGARPTLARLAAAIPQGVSKWAAGISALARPFSALRIPGLIAEGQERFRNQMSKVDHVVAVCDWVADVIRTNGTQEPQLSVSRQGITAHGYNVSVEPNVLLTPPVRIGYFGRIDPTKGVDLIAQALAQLPRAPIEFYLYLVQQPGTDQHLAEIKAQALLDSRIHIMPALQHGDVRTAMAACQLVIVPSRWLETGPLVVLEAFAAGVPVIGARRGGIAELVRDGIDGLLFEPGEADSLAATLAKIASDPELTERLRTGVRPPRTMDDVAKEMAAIYSRLIGFDLDQRCDLDMPAYEGAAATAKA